MNFLGMATLFPFPTGDLGDVAHRGRTHIRTLAAPKPLTILGVYKTLRTIAEMKVRSGDLVVDSCS